MPKTLFFDYHRQHGVAIKVARIFNTYGPRMHPRDGRVVSNFITQALSGEDLTIYGDGSQTRSFCYVDDLIDGFLKLMDSPADVTGPVNLGNPHEFTMIELAERVLKLTGAKVKVVHQPLPPTIRSSANPTSPWRAASSAGNRALNWLRDWPAPFPISGRLLRRMVELSVLDLVPVRAATRRVMRCRKVPCSPAMPSSWDTDATGLPSTTTWKALPVPPPLW